MTELELSWPPWLKDMTASQRIRAIVRAVAACSASHPPLAADKEAQHCTEAMAEHFLLKLLTEGDTA